MIGFHAQQAIEKAIKAVLAERELEIPRTHDLAYLLDSSTAPAPARRHQDASDPAFDGEPGAPLPSRRMAQIAVTSSGEGRAYLRLGQGEVRDSVELSGHDDADRIPTLDSLVLHFDHYGRLTAIEVTDSAPSVLPPALLDT